MTIGLSAPLGAAICACVLSSLTACSDPEPTVVTQVVGPAGGTIDGPGGATLSVPSGALPADTTITIKVAAEGTHPPLGAFTVAGQVFAFEPHGLQFASPATIKLPVTTPSADLVALRAEPDAPWEQRPAEIGPTTATIMTSSFSWFCIADPLNQPPTDAGIDAPADADSNAACAGRTPASASSGSVSNMQGTAPSYTAGTNVWPELALGTVVGGYATPRGVGVRVDLTDFTGACGLYGQGLHKLGGKSLMLFLYNSISVGAYTGGMYMGTQSDAPPDATQGVCTYEDIGDGFPPTAKTVSITAIDTTHIAGSFTATYQGASLSGTFDVPFCTQAPNLDPPACCVP